MKLFRYKNKESEKIQVKTFDLSLKTSEPNMPSSINVYLRENVTAEKEPLPAVIICPGGGYEIIASVESEPIALAFLSQGFQAIVLNYTTMQDGLQKNFLNSNILQIAKTFEIIEQNKDEWQIDPNKIFLLGCSAGGHLAASYSTSWHTIRSDDNSVNLQPRGTILCYPVTGFEFGWPKNTSHFDFLIEDLKEFETPDKINQNTPDTFIWHTANDPSVPVLNTLKYCEKLEENDIKFECHIFETGLHGLSLATRSSAKYMTQDYIDSDIATWFPTCIKWLNKRL